MHTSLLPATNAITLQYSSCCQSEVHACMTSSTTIHHIFLLKASSPPLSLLQKVVYMLSHWGSGFWWWESLIQFMTCGNCCFNLFWVSTVLLYCSCQPHGSVGSWGGMAPIHQGKSCGNSCMFWSSIKWKELIQRQIEAKLLMLAFCSTVSMEVLTNGKQLSGNFCYSDPVACMWRCQILFL